MGAAVPRFLAVLAVLTLHLQAVEPDWQRLANGRFDVWSQSGAGVAQEAAGHLEAVWRRIESERLPGVMSPASRIRVLAFSSERDFARFRVSPGSPAYFVGGSGGGIIVLSRLTKSMFPAASHELVHAFLRSGDVRWPWWMEEGLAEWIAHPGMAVREVDHLESLTANCGLKPAARMRAGCYEMAREQVAWMMADEARRDSFEAAMRMIAASGGAQRPGIRAVADEDAEDIGRVQEELLAALGRGEAAGAGPKDGTAGLRERGLDALARGRSAEAAGLLREAYEQGDRDAELLRHLAYDAQQRAAAGEMMAYLEALVEVSPAEDDSRIVLASHYLFQGQYERARVHLAAVKSPPEARRDYYLKAMQAAGLQPSSDTN